jgi:tetracycline resistance efflux pump
MSSGEAGLAFMTETPGWLSVVPPALAVAVALTTRRALPALLGGVLCAAAVLNRHDLVTVPAWTIDYLVETAARPDNLRLVAFSILVGGLLKLMQDSRAFDAFVAALTRWRQSLGRSTVHGLTWVFGSALILETWSNVLINGTTMGSLYDRLGIARERLAYYIHTIGINVVALVLLNSWGAFYLGLLNAQHVPDPLELLVRSVPYALYCWISLLLVAFVMITGFTTGPMRRFDLRARRNAGKAEPPAKAALNRPPQLRHMLVPVFSLTAGVLLGLWATGDGQITAGDGTASILYAVIGTLFITGLLLRLDRVFGTAEIEKKIITGSAGFLDVGLLIVLALATGGLTREMGTGIYVAQLLQITVPQFLIPALVFAIGAVISFATGTSYGTFSIIVPIALPIAEATGIQPELLFGACIAGGVFGDNTSPISDTTIISSLAANTQTIDHASTQLPFALIAAALAVFGYLLLGLFR